VRQLTPLENAIYNAGERLIPGVTHDLAEIVRHTSSYIFFCRVIGSDLAIIEKGSKPIQIVDLGCGVGHGCFTLSTVPNSYVVGVDNAPECLEYARRHYTRKNITYKLADLTEFIPAMAEYDYVVSRGVFEHIPNGLQLARSTKWYYRLLFDVPYDEPRGRNPHHILYGICEEAFLGLPEAELFFQDRKGTIYSAQRKPLRPNMIMCAYSHPDLPRIGDRMSFPLPAWKPGLGLRLRELDWPKITRWLHRAHRELLGRIGMLAR
jgi:SAM-dependent methyltransferase